MRTSSEQTLVDQLVRDLHSEFGRWCTVDELRREVGELHARYRDARVRDFVPALVYRSARETLKTRETRPASLTRSA